MFLLGGVAASPFGLAAKKSSLDLRDLLPQIGIRLALPKTDTLPMLLFGKAGREGSHNDMTLINPVALSA